MLLLWNNTQKTDLPSIWKKCLKRKKLIHFASVYDGHNIDIAGK